jgi:hypothetical protein
LDEGILMMQAFAGTNVAFSSSRLFAGRGNLPDVLDAATGHGRLEL